MVGGVEELGNAQCCLYNIDGGGGGDDVPLVPLVTFTSCYYHDLRSNHVIFQESMIKSTCKLVYKGYNGLGPDSLNEMFTPYQANRSLRSDDHLMTNTVPCRTQFGDESMRSRGSKYWNTLPTELKQSTTMDNFKGKIKTYTLNVSEYRNNIA